MRGSLFLCLAFLLSVRLAAAQTEPLSAEDLSIQVFLQEVETAISAMDRQRWTELLSTNADREQALEFFDAMVPQGITRVVVKERARAELLGTLPGDGYSLVTEVFMETGPRGRIATWNLDIRKPRGEVEDRQPWRIVAQDRLSSIEGLHRLVLHPDKQFAARNLVVRSVDFEVRLPAGQVFVAETPEGVTALVLLGDGTIVFSPAPKVERGQVRIFAGSETLDAAFTTALVRISPFEYRMLVAESSLVPMEAVDNRVFRRAQQVFEDDIANSFTLDLSDLSRDTWSLLPQPGDFVAEVRTRRFGKLTYARSTGEAEDVSLFQRGRKRNIAIYASEEKLASRGEFYNEDDLVEYDVLDYTVDSTFSPERDWLEGSTRVRLRVRAFALSAIQMKLADALTVNSVVSEQFGRLLFLRVRNQNGIVVNLPAPVARDFQLTLTVSYQGRLPRQGINEDSVEVAPDQQGPGRARSFDQPDEALPLMAPEPNWLFSNRAQWYPQPSVTDYATATMRITVPSEYAVVASGVQASGSPVTVGAGPNGQGGRSLYAFTATQPVRYLSMVVSRMSRADAATVALDILPPKDLKPRGTNGGAVQPVPAVPSVGSRNTVELAIEANRRQEGRGRNALPIVAEGLRFYAAMMGDVPYDSLTVAMVEHELPGGHAPGYVAVINNPLPTSPFSWRNDPAHFSGFPEFFLAHELAHQWFGQAVGWKNYHEQWLSEGVAQYLAALFAREQRGEATFRAILKQFRRWGLEESDEGPIFLGYRLGHIKGEPRVFRALVYNKGAAVLHMLRRLVGDDAFFRGLRRYYRENRFRKAGTDDLRKAMETESGRDLSRFFTRWVFDAGIPRLRYATTVSSDEVTVRIEQPGDVYDVPVTVTIQHADGRVTEEVVLATDAVTEARIPVSGSVRTVELNQDDAALAYFEQAR
ncbi:MAG: hypothetical protein IT179_21810 [Acidobacteria bacterium]|nr:hypothetical protein [Acidobacteriota bacterium]